jgi:hypothetical protein
MIDLGKFHPFGRMAMVRWTWTDADKALYDRTGKPPCWAGMLGSSTPMVVIVTQWNPWRVNYAPDEATLGEVELYKDAHPCLVVCSPFPKEIAHEIVQHWLVPSELMPMVQLGNLKREFRKGPLILPGQEDIEEFITPQDSLFFQVYEFLSGENEVEIGGFGNVSVNPRNYLKTMREYKMSGEINFEMCGNERGYAWNRVGAQLTD